MPDPMTIEAFNMIAVAEAVEVLQSAAVQEGWEAKFIAGPGFTRAYSVEHGDYVATVFFNVVCGDADAEWEFGETEMVNVIAQSDQAEEVTTWHVLHPHREDVVATMFMEWEAP